MNNCKENIVDVKAILIRLRKRLGLKTDLEVSRLFRVSPNTISTWKARNTVNFQMLIAICYENNISIDSILVEKENEEQKARRILV